MTDAALPQETCDLKDKTAATAAAAARAAAVWPKLQGWAQQLGFSQITVADATPGASGLAETEQAMNDWLAAGCHGDMAYMAAHGRKRARPAELVPGTLRVISARMDYLPADTPKGWQTIGLQRRDQARQAVVSQYALGRDYHKVLRSRLQKLADLLAAEVGPFGHRVFSDSAPVMEVALAQRSGLGWRGKNSLLLHRDAGSMFFLGELFVDLPLPLTPAISAHCGECTACITACPTGAIVAPYKVDARRCISYLTIELSGPIPLEFRRAIGNRIYGCDDCQLVCPWNKYAQRSLLPDFDARPALQSRELLALWAWTEDDFLRHTEGSAIRRIGWQRWKRNLAVAMGNAWRDTGDADLAQALQAARPQADALVAEHIDWALAQRSA